MPAAWMNQKRRWQRREWLNPQPTHHEMREPYGDFLAALPWDWWATFTFADEIYPYRAAQIYIYWAERLAAEVGRPMTHARAMEFQKRGVVHFHALIWNVGRRTNRYEWMATWETMGGGISRIFPYDRTQGAAHYLPKYVVKNGEVDILRFGPQPGRPDDVRMVRANQA